jgi:predicted enzyme related to lactoylglutathione lyase
MGRPVLHFEIVGKDGEALRGFYGDLFDWKFDVDDQFGYGTVARRITWATTASASVAASDRRLPARTVT